MEVLKVRDICERKLLYAVMKLILIDAVLCNFLYLVDIYLLYRLYEGSTPVDLDSASIEDSKGFIIQVQYYDPLLSSSYIQ